MTDARIVIGQLGTKRVVAKFLLWVGLTSLFVWMEFVHGYYWRGYDDRIVGGLYLLPFIIGFGGLSLLDWPHVRRVLFAGSVGLWACDGRLHCSNWTVALDEIESLMPVGTKMFHDAPDWLKFRTHGARSFVVPTALFRTPYDDLVAELKALGLKVHMHPYRPEAPDEASGSR